MAKANYNIETEKIDIQVTYNTNEIVQILDEKGNILSSNSTTANSGEELIGNGTYRYIVIDSKSNIKQIVVKVEGLSIYMIPDLQTLKEFRDEVNLGNSFEGIKVYQTADISMNEGKYTIDETTGEITFASNAEQWTPIGNTSSNCFKGIYDGMGHKISGIYINSADDYKGIFGSTYTNNVNKTAAIKNLTLSESYIIGGSYVGGIIGKCYYNYTATLEGLHTEKSKIKGTDYVGGVIGFSYNEIKLNKCSNSAEIEGNEYVGGIVGRLRTDGTIEKCYNSGKISGTKNGTGGIAGYGHNVYIIDCYNKGVITGKGSAGGITSNCSATNCYNIGEIIQEAGSDAGGITSNGSAMNCYNVGKIRCIGSGDIGGISGGGSATNCYNIGEIVNEGTGYAGGIVGDTTGKINTCYNKGGIISNVYSGGIVGYLARAGKLNDSYSIADVTGKKANGIVSGMYMSSKSNCYAIERINRRRYLI